MSTERCVDTRQGRLFSLSQQMSMIFRLWCNRWPWHSSRWWVRICATVQQTMQRTQENAILGKNAHNSTNSAKTGFPFKYSSPACKRRQSQQLDWWGDDPKTPQICGLSIVCLDLYRYHIWQWIIGLKLSIICCLSIIFLIIIILTYDIWTMVIIGFNAICP